MHVREDLIKGKAEARVAGLAWYNSKLKEKSTSEVRSNNNILCVAYLSSVIPLSLLASLFVLPVSLPLWFLQYASHTIRSDNPHSGGIFQGRFEIPAEF